LSLKLSEYRCESKPRCTYPIHNAKSYELLGVTTSNTTLKESDTTTTNLTIPCLLFVSKQNEPPEQAGQMGLACRDFLDTGAIDSNYISKQLYNVLRLQHHSDQIFRPCNTTVCGADGINCQTCIASCIVDIELSTGLLSSSDVISIRNVPVKVINSMFDFILGRKFILENSSVLNLLRSPSLTPECNTKLSSATLDVTPYQSVTKQEVIGNNKSEHHHRERLLSLIRSKEQLLGITPDTTVDDTMENNFSIVEVMDSIDLGKSHSTDDKMSKIDIDNTDSTFHSEILQLCTKYENVFSENLNTTPALLPSMEIHVDTERSLGKANKSGSTSSPRQCERSGNTKTSPSNARCKGYSTIHSY
jgi:hypothetical protein